LRKRLFSTKKEFMKKHQAYILLVGTFGLLAISWFLSSGQADQSTTTKTSGSAALKKMLPKNSSRPPLGELQSPAEDPENHFQRQLREALGGGRYRRGISDPGGREVNGQAETLVLTFIDGVTILKPGEQADPPGLPISSTAVVIGTVRSGRAFVSEDHTFVYSDYQVEINEVQN
jgi:hypothetical protein